MRAKAAARYAEHDSVEVIRVDSTLDTRAAALIKSEFTRMIADGRALAVIDLSDVSGIDSAGLGSVVTSVVAW